MDYIKYFTLLLDLLDFSESEKARFIPIAEVISHHLDRELIIQHRMAFLRKSWRDFLHDHITLEEFLATGDMSSNRVVWTEKENKIGESIRDSLQLHLRSRGQSLMFIFDEITFFAMSKSEQEKFQDEAEKSDTLLLIC